MIRTTNPELAFTFRELSEQIEASIAQDRIIAILSVFFGMLAVGLAGVGLFGMTAYAVTRRRRELAIRLAIGATPANIVQLMLGGVAKLLAGGFVVGAITSRWAMQFVQSLLFEIDTRDPVALVSVSGVVILTTIALGASAVPAYFAARMDSAEVLGEG